MNNSIRSFDRSTVISLWETFRKLQDQKQLTPITSFDQLNLLLSDNQKRLVEQMVALRPKDYGIKTPFAGKLEPVPSDLVLIANQKYMQDGVEMTLEDRYVPRHIFDAYSRMKEAFMTENSGRNLLVGSCYRSPAYQIVVFVWQLLYIYDGDVAKTIKQASPPEYSQHTIASKAAIDFKNVDGSPSDDYPEDFKATIEYAWLRKYANSFGFYESWLEGNEFGMRAEPWHWQFLGVSK